MLLSDKERETLRFLEALQEEAEKQPDLSSDDTRLPEEKMAYPLGKSWSPYTEAEDEDDDTEDFAEIPNDALPITDLSALALLKRLIESVYTAGITAIKYAYVDADDNIRCGFEDKISARLTLSFDGKLNSTLISYGISSTDLAEWDESDSVISFAAPATSKPRNCNPAKSFQCGNSCQKLGRNCTKNPSPGQKGAIAQIVDTTKKTKSPATKTSTPVVSREARRTEDSARQTSRLTESSFFEQDFETWNTTAESQSSELFNRKKAGTLTDRDGKLLDNHGIFRNVLEEASTGQKKNFRGLKDADGNLQVAALIKKKKGYLSLEYLVTAPWNISGGDKRASKGNGTAMMRSIVQESVDAGHGGKMKLIALEGSKTFYEKIGFTQTKVHKTQDGGSVYSMELSPNSAAEFLSKTGG